MTTRLKADFKEGEELCEISPEILCLCVCACVRACAVTLTTRTKMQQSAKKLARCLKFENCSVQLHACLPAEVR